MHSRNISCFPGKSLLNTIFNHHVQHLFWQEFIIVALFWHTSVISSDHHSISPVTYSILSQNTSKFHFDFLLWNIDCTSHYNVHETEKPSDVGPIQYSHAHLEDSLPTSWTVTTSHTRLIEAHPPFSFLQPHWPQEWKLNELSSILWWTNQGSFPLGRVSSYCTFQ